MSNRVDEGARGRSPGREHEVLEEIILEVERGVGLAAIEAARAPASAAYCQRRTGTGTFGDGVVLRGSHRPRGWNSPLRVQCATQSPRHDAPSAHAAPSAFQVGPSYCVAYTQG
jgi:hypothetical protein